jgi:ketosteroid isomerase-like protein
MSEQNVEVVRTFYERFARGDFDVLAAFSDDFEFVTSPKLPDAGTYRGEGAIRFMKTWVESFDRLTIEATEIIDAGDKVVVAIFQRGNLRGSQTAVDGRWWQVVTLRGGEVARVVTFPERAQALEAAGFSE